MHTDSQSDRRTDRQTDRQTDVITVSLVGRQDGRDESTAAVGGAPSHDAGHDHRAGGVVASDGGSLEEESQVTDGRGQIAD